MKPLLSVTDSVALPPCSGDDPGQVLDRLALALHPHAFEIRREDNAVIFEGKFILIRGTWDPLQAVGWARIEATRGPTGVVVRYRLSFTEFIVVISGFAAIMMIYQIGIPGAEFRPIFVFGPLALWAVIGGANIAWQLARFRAFVRRVATSSDKK